MEADLTRSREAGCIAHLIKPVAIADLRRAIASVHFPVDAAGGSHEGSASVGASGVSLVRPPE
jgi:hypothetical protein